MEYRKLGTTDFMVSPLCLGTMQFGWTADEETSLAILTVAQEAGVNFIDTADVYSRWVPGNPGGVSESIVGNWLKRGAGRRDEVVIATKVRGRMWESPDGEGLSRSHILRAVEGSLNRMGIDTIDLYQLHSPDLKTPIEETLRALDDLIRSGKVRAIGCSNFTAEQTSDALTVSKERGLAAFVSIQPHYNLVHRREYEAELESLCAENSLAVLPYSPLASGFLTGKYQRGQPPPAGSRGASSQRIRDLETKTGAWSALEALAGLADSLGRSPAQIALAWLLSLPTVTSPIIGPRSLEQLSDNLASVEIRLNQSERQALEEASSGL
ncbi:MAG TPA: aldo/keto reductase [Anaerolineales bacterium]|nr:aldo/keto reductase [Anaerolineales bacterium]